MVDFTAPVVFRFSVQIDGASADEDVAFREVSGLEAEVEVETVAEGGENRFAHRLPKPVRHPNLVLKRGIASADGSLARWCAEVIENDFSQPIRPRDVMVSLCDEEGEPLRTWSVGGAWPVKWSVGGLDAMRNEIAIETIELVYRTLQRKA